MGNADGGYVKRGRPVIPAGLDEGGIETIETRGKDPCNGENSAKLMMFVVSDEAGRTSGGDRNGHADFFDCHRCQGANREERIPNVPVAGRFQRSWAGCAQPGVRRSPDRPRSN
jgi:hypothetical protein